MNLAQLPNVITVIRILLIPPALWYLYHGDEMSALVIFAIAGFSDGVDGFLARRYGWVSRIGAVLDPIADKTLMTTFYLSLGLLGHLPWWLIALVVGRDMVIVGGAFIYRYLFGQVEMEPQWLSKINTLLQLTLVVSILWLAAHGNQDHWFAQFIIIAVTFSTLSSGISYVWTWGGRALKQSRG